MEIVDDIIISNVPDVMRSRDLLLRRLKDRAREEGLSDVLLCMVTAGTNGRAGIGFTSLEDLTENECVLRWSEMVFHDSV